MAPSAGGRSLVLADSNRFERGEEDAASCVAVSGGTARQASRLPDGHDVVTPCGEAGLRIAPGACR